MSDYKLLDDKNIELFNLSPGTKKDWKDIIALGMSMGLEDRVRHWKRLPKELKACGMGDLYDAIIECWYTDNVLSIDTEVEIKKSILLTYGRPTVGIDFVYLLDDLGNLTYIRAEYWYSEEGMVIRREMDDKLAKNISEKLLLEEAYLG